MAKSEKRLIEIIVSNCGSCLYCAKLFMHCMKHGKDIPFNGNPIPEWCDLPKHKEEAK